ncbi:MAG: C39 family peptidase [Methanoregula sp.]|uniref:C39 family peptidase n=1 Tax=Methanoregula sp. TaxID=2052170 RepID=UPI003C69063B
MKPMKYGVVLLALLLAAMAMVPMVSADETLQSSVTTGVDTDLATSIALLNVKDIAAMSPDFSSWNEATVTLSTTYYDLQNRKTAYAFSVNVNGDYEGYILVSATKENYPVLELSHGKLPNEMPEKKAKSDQIADTFAGEKGFVSASNKPIYLGGTYFYEKYELTNSNGKKQMDIYVDQNSDRIADISNVTSAIPLTNVRVASTQYQQQKDAEIAKQWNLQIFALNQGNATINRALISAQGTVYISGVPNYAWYLGCSPTAAGMVLGYWKNHGYSNLPSGQTLISELATAMGTSSIWPTNGGTWPWNINSGIMTVCSNHGYSNFNSYSYIEDPWSTVTSEINAQRPFVLSMYHGGTATDTTTAYGDHSVACVGYMEGSTLANRWLTIQDTWDTSRSHLIQFGNWWSSQETYVRP